MLQRISGGGAFHTRGGDSRSSPEVNYTSKGTFTQGFASPFTPVKEHAGLSYSPPHRPAASRAPLWVFTSGPARSRFRKGQEAPLARRLAGAGGLLDMSLELYPAEAVAPLGRPSVSLSPPGQIKERGGADSPPASRGVALRGGNARQVSG
ncbi:hypothetical protein AAFF_G00133580 [Aldrovandia affinis]|uniref:Uncharacterized protein n=1 Tax=Aldrovandia affinis TaxID=143900 RepID=A0AAD7W945_9TELE|nr:hypothetical protein AAFF_G00133580 [Aldrovandia affinis]